MQSNTIHERVQQAAHQEILEQAVLQDPPRTLQGRTARVGRMRLSRGNAGKRGSSAREARNGQDRTDETV